MAQRHDDGGLGRPDDRDSDRLLDQRTVARHAGAAHDQHIGAMAVAQGGGWFRPPRQARSFVSERGDAELDRQIAGEPAGVTPIAAM